MFAIDLVDELDDATAAFFPPARTDLIDELIGQYRQCRARIAEVAQFVNGKTHAGVIHYFLEGNKTQERGRMTLESSAAQLFDEKGAVAALNSAYWSKALALTNVLDIMPQARRDEWHKTIDENAAPDFEDDTVRSTLQELLAMRAKFFAERVDGLFRGLSGEHVTNAPEAFGKRMILLHALSSYGTVDHSTCGLINDLRCVVAKFMGREDEPKYGASSQLVQMLKRRWGEWVSIDGGAMRIRLYKKGTAHLEIHPDMAWRLNAVLANLYPAAIPAKFRQKPARRARQVELIQRPLPFQVLEVLAEMRQARRRGPDLAFRETYQTVPNTFCFGYGAKDSGVIDEVERVLIAIGGAKTPEGWWQFDYWALDVISQIVVRGCIPDERAHQFYPTLRPLAERVIEAAQIGAEDEICEPSAGQGGLADLLPRDRTTCVEIAELNARVLEAKGHRVVRADFLEWARVSVCKGRLFDCVVMNPPFADGRALAHLQAAATIVRARGRIAAVLPAGLRGKDILPGWDLHWSPILSNQFPGVSVDVVVLTARRPH